MDRLTYENVRSHPELLDALVRRARCERAEAVHRLIILPIKRLFSPAPAAMPAPCAARSF